MQGPQALLAVAAAALLAGCDEAAPPAAVPPSASAGGHTGLSPIVYVLRPDQLPAYRRSALDSVSPGNLASTEGDPSLRATLEAEGFTVGARATYASPGPGSGTAFGQVVSEAVVFRDPAGADRFVGEEGVRRNRLPEGGGSIAPLAGLPSAGVDRLVAFATTTGDGGSGGQAFLVVARRGRVVAELFCGGPAPTATRGQLEAVLQTQVALLQQPPEVGG